MYKSYMVLLLQIADQLKMNKIHQSIMLPTKKQRLVEIYDGYTF